MEVGGEYQKHVDKEDLALIEIFKCILDAWYRDIKEDSLTPAKAQEQFLGFLKEAHCSNFVQHKVKQEFSSLTENRQENNDSEEDKHRSECNDILT